ncbi:hypothetical protein DUNSADRAFT_10499 [Dunaliella salina]|uniref:Encoded protein n=1 Tax=Dunaliella salina TaxID=3046 RepID=A0ABQ7GF81_DUNSA|nr:hypothetical protein DUNSADRAFT_10499 [Dunaliella salina]|eukprot:KAF5833261.1 hypothetical protein DUNSADRAFT_10499 [Dunaliella salina]
MCHLSTFAGMALKRIQVPGQHVCLGGAQVELRQSRRVELACVCQPACVAACMARFRKQRTPVLPACGAASMARFMKRQCLGELRQRRCVELALVISQLVSPPAWQGWEENRFFCSTSRGFVFGRRGDIAHAVSAWPVPAKWKS